MFRNAFSFEGRIRRLEYFLSRLISVFGVVGIVFLLQSLNAFGLLDDEAGMGRSFTAILLCIPIVWFSVAQGVKRCHDLGDSGWWQLVPFYSFSMLFSIGDYEENDYGLNPKGRTSNEI